jgi:hypothetical protein
MKTFIPTFSAILIMAAFMFIPFSSGCKKKTDNTNNTSGNCNCWNENWLIGTWEGTTPSTIEPFSGTKIRIVFEQAYLQTQDTISGNTRKIWTYRGTFTWDVDSAAWSASFDSANYPLHNTILWECVAYVAMGQSINNASFRIGDLIQVDPYHTIDLDWGPISSGTGVPPTYIDVYGDVELDINGVIHRADYPPEAGSMIRLTKK